MKKRVLVFALSVLMIFSCLPTAFAADEPQVTEPPQVTETPQSTEMPQISEEPTPQPTETPAPTPSPEPTAIPEPSSEPTVAPEPLLEPTVQPEGAMLPQSESEAYIVNATSGDYEYSVNEDGSATITKYYGAGGDITIPDTLDGYKVTVIGDSAFRDCHSIIRVTVQNGVTSIGDNAFGGCRELSFIEVNNENGAFSSLGGVLFNKTNTQLIKYPEGKTTVNYEIPFGVTAIGDYAFYGCNSYLTSITIPDSVITIGEFAFQYAGITSIMIPAGVSAIGNGAFECTKIREINASAGNSNYASIDGILFNKDTTKIIKYPAGKTASAYSIPGTVTEICNYAFACSSYLKDITIPDGVTSIGNYAFSECERLTGIYLPDNINTIGEGAFLGCLALCGVHLPVNLTRIEAYTFVACSSLRAVRLPESLTEIGNQAFSQCDELATIHIPDKVKSIGDSAFWSDGKLSKAYFYGDAPAMGQNVFHVYTEGLTIFYRNDKTGFTNPWYGYETISCEMSSMPPTPDSGHADKSGDFEYWVQEGYATVTRYIGSGGPVAIPNTLDGIPVKAINSYVFEDNESITSVVLPQNITSVGENAFIHCTNLNSVTMPDGVISIGVKAFYRCTSLKSIVLPRSLTCIDYALFDYCTSLRDVTIPEGVTRIEGYAFSDSALLNVTIPKSVTYIGCGAFSNSGLSKIYFRGNAPQINITNVDKDIFDFCSTQLTVYYLNGSSGFTNPWHGCPTATFDPSAPCTVTYDLNGIGETIHLYENLYKGLKADMQYAWCQGQDYIFSGWYTNKECTGTAWDFNNPVNENMTLYAKWISSTCTVSFDTQGGNTINPVTIKYGEFLFYCGASRNGYEFLGWYPTPACDTVPISFPYRVEGNTVLYAKWQAIGMKPIAPPSGIPSPYLAGVNYTAGSISRAFAKTVYSYKLLLGENEGSVTLAPARDFGGAVMTINGKAVSSYTLNLANGKSAKISVKVKYGKTSKTYTFTVTRAKSTNNALSSLGASAGTWSQPFDPNVTNYTLTLPEGVKSTAIQAAAAAGKAARVSPASKKITLNNGQSKTVRITVKAQSGARRTYTITVVRAASTNADLKSLKTSAALSPAFNPGVTSYAVTLPANKAAFNISAKAAGYKAAVYIDGAKKLSKKIALANGQTTVVVVRVVSQAGNEKQYVITVTRQ